MLLCVCVGVCVGVGVCLGVMCICMFIEKKCV